MGRLLRVELFNFKSYKGHHVLGLSDSYFTSIVGPNGSGKSNSMDAISFVLGIKSSHLRSTHLRDLIYRGRVLRTSKINADGSATANGANGEQHEDAASDGEPSRNSTQERNDPKSAWVMAVYEDAAGDAQFWKRTITNQGISEYRINDKVVSAHQYNEALESENILIKARNFLVFQGDVEAIASQSPQDLTRLIEQISGSIEYKADYERLKAAQEEALEVQNRSLYRRRTINSEIKQCEEQKVEADNYTMKARERDQAVVTHILWKLYHFQRAIEESEAEMQKHQEELKEHRRNIEKYQNSLEEAKKNQTKASRDVAKVEASIKQKNKGVEIRENELVPIAEKIDITEKNLAKCEARIAEITKERDSHQSSVNQTSKDLKIIDKAQTQWENELRMQAEQEGRVLTEADIQQYNLLKEEVNMRASADQLKVDNLARQVNADEETVHLLKKKVDSTQWKIEKLNGELGEIDERKDTVKSQINRIKKEISSKKKTFNEHTSERLRLAQIRTEKDEKLQEVLRKLLEAEDGKKQNEKDVRLRQNVADMKRIYPGVKGRVSDLCKPIEKRFQIAVSTIMGRNFDAVIVEDEKTAIDCIEFLRDQRRGQLTFIPLDRIQWTAVNSNLKGVHRGSRMAIDTVKYESSLERAISYVCGNAIICDDLAIAKYICWDKGNDVKAVTLDGSIIHKGGNMTGGRGPQGDTRRFEDTEVENLRKLKEKLLADLSSLPDPRRGASEEETLQGELIGLEQRLAYASEELIAFERNQSSKQKELVHAQRELATAEPKYSQKLPELEKLKAILRKLRDSVGKIEDQIFAEFCKRFKYDNIRIYEAQQGSLQHERAQKKLEFISQKSRLESRISYEKKQLQETINRIQVLANRAQQDQALIDELGAEQQATQDDLENLHSELDKLSIELEGKKVTHAQKSAKVAEQRKELQQRSGSVDGILKEIDALEAERQLKAASRYTLLRRCKLENINLPLDEDSNPLDELPIDDILHTDPDAMDVDEDPNTSSFQTPNIPDYGIEIDFDDLDEHLRQSDDSRLEDELQEAIQSLGEELDRMAPNMHAIERLESVQDKLKTTDKEFEDARRRAKQAREDFQEVKEQRFDLFSKAFAHISEEIGGIYRELTKSEMLPTGGQAFLDLEDSDEPYLEGIKYHAMPPLKRFRDMEHLSGGEKTIAALALLFAIHSWHPSPFFVLDEVDAALDNANVARIARYIRGHARPGMQFIVISLKNVLFQMSETLVGIYRDQGANSSKSLTLDRYYSFSTPRMDVPAKEVDGLLDFINSSPTPFHAVHWVKERLVKAGFREIQERNSWHETCRPGGKYYLTRNSSTIVAFAIGKKWKPGNPVAMIGAHTDSPALRIKPISKKEGDGYIQVGVETYGGGLWHTWFDRDLSIAGRAMVQLKNGDFVQKLVKIDRPILRVPTLAIHLDRQETFSFNKETQLFPIAGLAAAELNHSYKTEAPRTPDSPDSSILEAFSPLKIASERHHPRIVELVAKEAGVSPTSIVDFELLLYDTQKSVIGGLNEELIFSPRLDNLAMSYCATISLINSLSSSSSLNEQSSIRLISLFDHEEIGSQTAQGADSNILPAILRRLSVLNGSNSRDATASTYEQTLSTSFLISADMAHAVNPNYAAKYESDHKPQMNRGTVIKINANSRYATNSPGIVLLQEVARRVRVPLQLFVVRNDSSCGSTIGPMLSASLGTRTLDLGNPQLSMHSIRETGGVYDVEYAIKLFESFFENYDELEVKILVD